MNTIIFIKPQESIWSYTQIKKNILPWPGEFSSKYTLHDPGEMEYVVLEECPEI